MLNRWIVLLLAALPLAGAAPVWAQSTAPAPEVAEIPVAAVTTGSDLSQLALLGRFELLRHSLDDLGPDATPHSAALIEALKRYEELDHRRQQVQLEQYRAALERLQSQLDGGDIEEALIAAIEAYGVAPSPDALLNHGAIRRAVILAQQQATQAEHDENWVDAIATYRLLHLLYEQDGRFRDDLLRANRRVRLLQVYNPDLLEELYRKHAVRKAAEGDGGEGGEVDPLPHIERDDWTVKLAGIDREMLKEAMAWTATKHVDAPGYRPLLIGAMDSIKTLLATRGLEQSFPTLRQPGPTAEFSRFIDRLLVALRQGNARIGDFEAESLIDSVLEKNRLTLALPEAVLIYEMGNGATEQVDDYTQVKWPAELMDFTRDTRGRFYGVGIQISRRDDRLIVVSPLENTPAHAAGIKAGDYILKVNGLNAATWSLERAVREITGPEGSDVRLTVERNGEPRDFTLRRGEIKVESIRGWQHRTHDAGGGWDYWIDRDSGIAYVRLSTFIPQTADDLDTAIAQLQEQGKINGLILDLRFNGGGLLGSSVQIADRFITRGDIVSTVDADGLRTDRHRAEAKRTYPPFPLVVLVNQGTASASEIVSGALQDHGRATILGTRSFGKGSVQDVFGLSNRRAALKITRQYYMLPRGRIIHRKEGAKEWGVEPDLVVPMTDSQVAQSLEMRRQVDVLRDEAAAPALDAEGQPITPPTADTILEKGLDPQLEVALLVLKARLVASELTLAAKDEPATGGGM